MWSLISQGFHYECLWLVDKLVLLHCICSLTLLVFAIVFIMIERLLGLTRV